MTAQSQLRQLVEPFPARYVHENPSGGGSYVSHDVVTQRLLQVLGPFTFVVTHVIRGDVDGREPNPQAQSKRGKAGSAALTNVVVGALCTLEAVIDGRPVAVTEIGDCEDPHNWPHDGARLKDALSDCIKRCAMRMGLGLHLWSGEEYFLPQQLDADEAKKSAVAA